MSLGRSVAAAVSDFLPGKPGKGSRNGRTYYFTSLTPILPGHDTGLVAYLEGLPLGSESPLARVANVHLARWLVIDHLKMDWRGRPRRPTELRSKYLLFTACVTGPSTGDYAKKLPGSFLEELAGKIPEADAIWGNCFGYPGRSSVDAFVEYLGKSQLDTLLFFLGYPDRTVDDVVGALRARERLVSFVRRNQDEDDPARLQQAYLEESATWRT